MSAGRMTIAIVTPAGEGARLAWTTSIKPHGPKHLFARPFATVFKRLFSRDLANSR